MKYLAILKQCGEGCDYTIGCGMALKWVEAETINDAADQILQEEGCGYLDPDSETKLKKLFIVCSNDVEWIDLGLMQEEFRKQKQQEKMDQKEQLERLELHRLQEKYG